MVARSWASILVHIAPKIQRLGSRTKPAGQTAGSLAVEIGIGVVIGSRIRDHLATAAAIEAGTPSISRAIPVPITAPTAEWQGTAKGARQISSG